MKKILILISIILLFSLISLYGYIIINKKTDKMCIDGYSYIKLTNMYFNTSITPELDISGKPVKCK